MGDVISAGDRALIDAHIRRHGVVRVATGVSGLDPDAFAPSAWRSAHANRTRRIEARRKRVLARIKAGDEYAAIAAALGVSRSVVDTDVKALKKAGQLPADLRNGGRNGWIWPQQR